MKKLILLFLCLILSYAAYANYEMHGTYDDNNDGTYTVHLQSDTGREYLGLADIQGDGTLNIHVAIQGGGSEIYIGTGKLAENGAYIFSLRNNTTGDVAFGTMIEY